MATKQIDKQRLGLAGEYGVCSELLKRGYDASLTLGNAKAIDIILIQSGTVKTIEVKTSKSNRIVTGFFKKYPTPTSPHPDYWVLVHIDSFSKSRFFILTHSEMASLQMQRNGVSLWASTNGVDTVLLSSLQPYEDQWSKII